jgi:hypothetical protein
MKQVGFLRAFFHIPLCKLFSGIGNAATLALDPDLNTTDVQSNQTRHTDQILSYVVDISGDNLTQFDTFAFEPIHTSPLVMPQSPVSASPISDMTFTFQGEAVIPGLFSGGLVVEESGTLLLIGFPSVVDTELSLAGEMVPVTLQEATVDYVPPPPAMCLFSTGVLSLLSSARGWKGETTDRVKPLLCRWLFLALGLVTPYCVSAANSNADLNGDAVVTSQDVSVLASCFGQDPTVNSACVKADVDDDGDIDQDDFGFVSARLGQAYPEALYPLPFKLVNVDHTPTSVVNGDINGDNHIDVIAVNRYDDSLSLLIGNGEGSFSEKQHITVGDEPTRAVLEDINGDGDVDLVVANSGSDDISVILGNGDGTFQDQQRFAGGGDRLAVGDMNGDGKLDIVTTSTELSVLLGNGDGTLQAEQRYTVGERPSEVKLGDMNGDGLLDVVTSRYDADVYGTVVSVLLGNGDGSVQERQNPTDIGSSYPNAPFDLGDINGDGALDVLVAIHPGLVILLGNGDGTIQSKVTQNGAYLPTAIALGDIDGDGALDAVTLSADEWDLDQSFINVNEHLAVFMGNGDGSFQQREIIHVTSTSVNSVTLGDTNADGQLDIITNSYDSILIMLSGIDSYISSLDTIIKETLVSFPGIGDLNNDGILDLLVDRCDDNYTCLTRAMLGSRERRFQTAWSISFSAPRGVGFWSSLGDLNGDSLLDLVLTKDGFEYGYHGHSVYFGDGDGSFHRSPGNVFDGPFPFTFVDINGDGSQELVGGDRIIFSDDNGNLQEPQRNTDLHLLRSEVLRDLNGDNMADAVGFTEDGDIMVMLGYGDGRFQEHQRYSVSNDTSTIVLDDPNSDGKLDVVTFGGERIGFLFGKGGGSFQEQQLSTTRTSLSSGNFGDINGDGAVDLVGVHGGNIVLLLGKGDGNFHEQYVLTSNFTVTSAILRDFDGDGLSDLMIKNKCVSYDSLASQFTTCISIMYGEERNP